MNNDTKLELGQLEFSCHLAESRSILGDRRITSHGEFPTGREKRVQGGVTPLPLAQEPVCSIHMQQRIEDMANGIG